MAKGFKCGAGGGGSSLLLTVNAYDVPEALPITAAENTVGIITTTPISSWAFSPTEPEAPEEGMVWAVTDIGGDVSFNPLKKGSIVLYPVSARQYIDGAWKMVEAWIFTAGSWAQFGIAGIYLYNAGDTCESVTGGYYAAGLKPAASQASAAAPSVAYGEGSMTITGSNSYTYNGGYVRTNNMIDLTDFSKIVFEGSRTGVGTAALHAWTSIGSYIYQYSVANCNINAGDTVVELDVSALSGPHYVGFSTAKNNDGSAIIEVASFRLE